MIWSRGPGRLYRRVIEDMEPTEYELARRWIPVTERLPPVDEKVLYTCLMAGDCPEDYFTDVNAGYWDGKSKNIPGDPAMKYDDSNDWEPCTHWMPLPAPPQIDK